MAVTNNHKKTESIISADTGAVIGGRVIRRAPNGIVTIDFAGLQKSGRPLSLADLKQIELGQWTGEPPLKTLGGIVGAGEGASKHA